MLQLLPFQEEALSKLPAILADKCGLGKTLVYAEFIRKSDWKYCLVLTRKNVVLQTALFLEQQLDVRTRIFKSGKKPVLLEPHIIYVGNYEAIQPDFYKLVWDIVICDEAHWIKNRHANRTKKVLQLQRKVMIPVTATPTNKIFNGLPSPEELWALLHALNPNEFRSYWGFVKKYGKYAYYDQYGQLTELPTGHGFSKLVGLRDVTAYKDRIAPFFIQRTKSEVAPQLPPVTPIYIALNMTPTQSRVYNELVEQTQNALRTKIDGVDLLIQNKLALLTRLHQVVSYPRILGYKSDGIKFGWIDDWLEENIDESVIFISRYVPTILALERRYGISVVTGQKKTYKQGDKRVGLTAQTGVGLDLPHISTAIVVDMWYSSIVNEQARDRIYRLSNTEPKTIYYLNAYGTVDDIIFQADKERWTEQQLIQRFVEYLYG